MGRHAWIRIGALVWIAIMTFHALMLLIIIAWALRDYRRTGLPSEELNTIATVLTPVFLVLGCVAMALTPVAVAHVRRTGGDDAP